MKAGRREEISESEESEDSNENRKSSTKNVAANNSSSEFSSDQEEEHTRPSTPPNAHKYKKVSTSPQKRVTFNPLERFVSENEHLTKLDVNDVISEDDDVCVFEIPKTINPHDFTGKLVNFDRKTKLKLNNIKYIIEPQIDDLKPISLLTNKLKILHPISVLKLREYKKKRYETEGVHEVASSPSLPNNLKVRHPLFGSEYEHKIVLNEEIQRKIDESVDKAIKKLKKKQLKVEQELKAQESEAKMKKKHKKKIKTENGANIEPEQEDNAKKSNEEYIFSMLEAHVSGQKHDKSFDEEENYPSDNVFSENEDVKPKRTHKTSIKQEKKADSSLMNFDHENKKKKRKNSVKEERSLQEPIKSTRPEKTEKKRKHKNSLQNESSEENSSNSQNKNNSFEAEENVFSESEDNVPKRKHKSSFKQEKVHDSSAINSDYEEKKKKRKNSVKEERSLQESIDSSETDKTEKKRKHKSSLQIEPTIQSESFGANNSLDDGKNKKKKKSQTNIKAEILSQDEIDDADASLKQEKRNRKSSVKENDEQNRRNSLLNSTVIPDLQLPLFEFDVSSIGNREEQNTFSESADSAKSPKKKKDRSFETEKGSLEESLNATTHDGSGKKHKRKPNVNQEDDDNVSPKKKPKKIKEESEDEATNSLILNLLSKAKSELGSDIKPKKKRKSEN